MSLSVRLFVPTLRCFANRLVLLGELFECRGPLSVQLVDMERLHASNQTQMVVVVSLLITTLPPGADVALRYWHWVVVTWWLCDCGLESFANDSVVRAEIRETKALLREPLAWLYHVHKFRRPTLDLGHELGIHAELKYRPTLGLLRELGVDHFIRPVAKLAWLGNLDQNIGSAAPPSVPQFRLHNRVSAATHCLNRPVGCGATLQLSNIENLTPVVLDIRKIGRLVSQPTLLQQGQHWAAPVGLGQIAFSHRAVQLSQMAAAKVLRKVGRRK